MQFKNFLQAKKAYSKNKGNLNGIKSGITGKTARASDFREQLAECFNAKTSFPDGIR
ncbi:MAG: hypothetical protein Q8P57_04910 [Candidatus Pacearchaeota archaeon]|nr:hypothetical protein [Candidatus Pacearchaeota archaeon]